MHSHQCPLCSATSCKLFHVELPSKKPNTKKIPREYYQCTACHLVFVPESYHLSATAEKAEYEEHDNVFSDEGYQAFLTRATDQVLCYLESSTLVNTNATDFDALSLPANMTELFNQYCTVIGQPKVLTFELGLQFLEYLATLSLPAPVHLGVTQSDTQISPPSNTKSDALAAVDVLDFGCGPMPVLGAQLSYLGCSVSVYDKYFYPDETVLKEQYDVITCTEVIEHIWQAAAVWEQFHSLLKPHGMLLIMTKRVIDETRFAQWHYKNDPTHICFYHEKTAIYLAQQYGWTVTYPTNDIMLFTAGH